MMARARSLTDALPLRRAFSVPKGGHALHENEDAAAGPSEQDGVLRAAVADGATEGVFSGVWARALAEAALHDPDPARAVAAARAAFEAAVAPRRAALPWYAAAQAEAGANAAVIAIELKLPTGGGAWRAWAVGDACLLHLRAEEGGRLRLATAWPLDDPAAFGARPRLVRSAGPLPAPEHAAGTWQPGDAFVLATDALAAHLLATDVAAALRPDSPDAFDRFVADARAGGLRNDDATLLVLAPTPAPAPTPALAPPPAPHAA